VAQGVRHLPSVGLREHRGALVLGAEDDLEELAAELVLRALRQGLQTPEVEGSAARVEVEIGRLAVAAHDLPVTQLERGGEVAPRPRRPRLGHRRQDLVELAGGGGQGRVAVCPPELGDGLGGLVEALDAGERDVSRAVRGLDGEAQEIGVGGAQEERREVEAAFRPRRQEPRNLVLADEARGEQVVRRI